MGFKVVKQKGTLVFLDLEGANPEGPEPISQIAAMTFSIADFGLSETGIPGNAQSFCKLINPKDAQLARAKRITELTDRQLKCETFEEAFSGLKAFLDPLVKPIYLVAHSGNAFDFPTLRKEAEKAKFKKLGETLKLTEVDTFPIFLAFGERRKDPKWTNGLVRSYHRLFRLKNRKIIVEESGPHDAMQDVQILIFCCKRIQRIFIKAAKRETPTLW